MIRQRSRNQNGETNGKRGRKYDVVQIDDTRRAGDALPIRNYRDALSDGGRELCGSGSAFLHVRTIDQAVPLLKIRVGLGAWLFRLWLYVWRRVGMHPE